LEALAEADVVEGVDAGVFDAAAVASELAVEAPLLVVAL
jgi:hypothetical protein